VNQPFVLALLRNPRQIGAVVPSGQSLARAMAVAANPSGKRVLEIGPGTGVITNALLAEGASREELCLLERDDRLANYLSGKFPDIRVVKGDARSAADVSRLKNGTNFEIVISSLPLLNVKEVDKISILEQIFSLLDDTGILVQYTYSTRAPISPALANRFGVKGERTAMIFRNLPPASVWKYSYCGSYNFQD
jgi:phosphatidylethanolamine/phosphatidyl-N-methylethanolamine N-methyltransferase